MSLLTWFSEQPDTWDISTPHFDAGKNIQREEAKEGEKHFLQNQTSKFIYPMYPPSRLVPLDQPWKDGSRYRPAGAAEIASRLDCFLEDPEGPYVRLYGTLLRFDLTRAGRTAAIRARKTFPTESNPGPHVSHVSAPHSRHRYGYPRGNCNKLS